jgi:hypothetical protein
MRKFASLLALPALALLVANACDKFRPNRQDLDLPPIDSIQAIYAANGQSEDLSYSGNVVEIDVVQSADQLRRGGSLWARVGPYIHLLTPATRQVFDTYAGVAAVRVVTRTTTGQEIARAMLLRNTFEETRWRRSLNLLGHALQEGSERPSQIEALVRWGEDHTEHSYNRDFVPNENRR